MNAAPTTLVIDELARSTGVELGPGRWIEIDQRRIDTFAAVTEDRQWIHVDPVRASFSPLGSAIAHGYLTLSLTSAVIEELLDVPDAASVVNYGANRVRYPAPVPVGSRLRGRLTVLGSSEVTGGQQVAVRVTIEREGTVKPVCVTDMLMRYLRGE